MVKRLLDLKNASRNDELSLKKNCFNQGTFGDRTLAYSGAKVQSRFYPGDLITRKGDREICSVSGRVGMYANVQSPWLFTMCLNNDWGA